MAIIESYFAQIFAILSVLASSTVIAHGIFFPSNMFSSRKPFSHIIYIISICDMISSIGNSFGYAEAGTFPCKLQGFLSMSFISASWFWTAMLVFQLRCFIVYKKLSLSILNMHMICWGFALLNAFGPLFIFNDANYGQDDEVSGTCFCNIYGGYNTYLWFYGVYYGSLMISMIIMLSCRYQINSFLKNIDGVLDAELQQRLYVFKMMKYYPISMIFTWLPVLTTIYTDVFIFKGSNKAWIILYGIAYILSTQYGTLMAVIFYSQSEKARKNWKEYFSLNTYNFFNESLCLLSIDGSSSNNSRNNTNSVDTNGNSFENDDELLVNM